MAYFSARISTARIASGEIVNVVPSFVVRVQEVRQ
jgi:hypothetical protein